MSDRRERVARAMAESTGFEFDNPLDLNDSDRTAYLRVADAALSVIDAEPTEAEVEAAIDARDLVWEEWRALQQDERVSNREAWEVERRAMRAALIAARKVGPE